MNIMTDRILCVDDDANILQGYQRALRKEFDISTATGGEDALVKMREQGPFAVVVSDMRMPGMDGVQLLARVKQESPDSVRIMLTGNADQQTAMDAVNEGNIFRFLTKPCTAEHLGQALRAGLEQHRLITAEKVLLEQTLKSSLKVLIDIISLVNPTAFSRASRVKRVASQLAQQLELRNRWEIEVAALLSQIGCVTVPEATLQKISECQPLNGEELRMFQQHPQIGHDLLARIPRMERVARIIQLQNLRFRDQRPSGAGSSQDPATIGAMILNLSLDFDRLIDSGNSARQALAELSGRMDWYDPVVLEALNRVIDDGPEDEYVHETRPVAELKPGMVLDQPAYTAQGMLIVAKDQEVSFSLILRLTNFVEAGVIDDVFQVRIPVSMAGVAPMAASADGINSELLLTVIN
jgi:response regulator RpfG family c-di-GMP phosphodiesterase